MLALLLLFFSYCNFLSFFLSFFFSFCEATVLAKRSIRAIFTSYLPGEIIGGKLLLLWVTKILVISALLSLHGLVEIWPLSTLVLWVCTTSTGLTHELHCLQVTGFSSKSLSLPGNVDTKEIKRAISFLMDNISYLNTGGIFHLMCQVGVGIIGTCGLIEEYHCLVHKVYKIMLINYFYSHFPAHAMRQSCRTLTKCKLEWYKY